MINKTTPETTPLAFGRQAEIFPWGEGRVLKLFIRAGIESAQHEFNISKLAFTQGARTPHPYEIIEKDGRPGIIFEKVEGPSLLWMLGKRPWLVKQLGRQFADLHHTVHRCHATELPNARSELEKAIWSRSQLSTRQKGSLVELLYKLPDGDSLLHGDFHPDNVMVTSRGFFIIDWPNAARGCPLADVARTTIILRFGDPVGELSLGLWVLARFMRGILRKAYIDEYYKHSPFSKKELGLWEIILAAHRIGDHIPGEEPKLLKFINRNLNKKLIYTKEKYL